MKTKAESVSEYLDSIPEDRKEAIVTVRKLILKNLPKGFKESINWGMICYEVPLSTYPDTYNKKPLLLMALGSQKNYMVLHMCNLYMNKKHDAWFREQYKKLGMKLDMGAGCVRFKKLEDLPLKVIAQTVKLSTVKQYIAHYEKGRKIGKQK